MKTCTDLPPFVMFCLNSLCTRVDLHWCLNLASFGPNLHCQVQPHTSFRPTTICKLLGLKYVKIGNNGNNGNKANLMETAYVLMGNNELIITHFRHL